MGDILDKLTISGSVGSFYGDLSYGEDKIGQNIRDEYVAQAQAKYERQQRNKRLIWLGFTVVIGYFIYTSFVKK